MIKSYFSDKTTNKVLPALYSRRHPFKNKADNSIHCQFLARVTQNLGDVNPTGKDLICKQCAEKRIPTKIWSKFYFQLGGVFSSREGCTMPKICLSGAVPLVKS